MSLASLGYAWAAVMLPHALFFISPHQPMKVELNIC